MKSLTLNHVSMAAAILTASATSFAQTITDPFTSANIPKIPSIQNISIDLATMAAQQSQMVSELIGKVHEQANTAARSVLGMAADTMNPDELEAALAERIPGFAGWVHREDGTSVMRMAGIKAVGAATALLHSPHAAAFAAAAGSKVSVQAALWDSRQLLDFKERVFALAAPKGVLATWINRETNRIEVRYDADLDAASIDALTDQLVAAGVPRSAVVLSPGAMVVSAAATNVSVREQTLPLAGGSQIVASGLRQSQFCTLGVPAIRSGVRGFVTASHCSYNTFGMERPGLFGDSFNSAVIADEKVDPKGAACPTKLASAARGCRNSDALFAATRASNAVDLGKLLMTPSPNNLRVSKILNVVGSKDFPAVNQTVYKTGRTTGTTSAKVARLCVDQLILDVNGETIGLRCSVEVDSASFGDSGDSGSPVWLSSNGAVITGIFAYKAPSASYRGFSPWGAVVKDLGNMTIK